MFFVYVLQSLKDMQYYIGYTNNMKRRLSEHNRGYSFATSFRRPFKCIYVEGCLNEQDAKRREGYLKTTQGRRFLGLRLVQYTKAMRALGNGS